jgi:hypothetical protein
MIRHLILCITFFVTSSLVLADDSEQSLYKSVTSMATYKVMACEKYLLAERLTAELSYQGLIDLLSAQALSNGHVLLMRGGRGEFALQNSKPGSIKRHALAIPVYHPHFYFQLDRLNNKSIPITANEYRSAMEWRPRPAEMLSRSQRLSHFARSILMGATPHERDPVHYRSAKHSYLMQMVWRYTMNSISDEGYALVRHLIAKNIFDVDHLLIAVDAEKNPTNFRRLTRRIWQQAAQLGYPIELNDELYPAEELEQMLDGYKIKRSTQALGGDSNQQKIMFEWGNKQHFFIKELSVEQQYVYRRISKIQFDDSNV